MSWDFATATHIGGRAEQQDRVSVIRSERNAGRLVIVADGMGGHEGGAVAAQQVVDTAAWAFRHTTIERPRVFFERVCLDAHENILASDRAGRARPGSTCALLYLVASEAYWAHVGDSRLYHFSAEEIHTRTEDHSLAALSASGTRAAGRPDDPETGQLYMCLGGRNRVSPDFAASAVDADDWFMLCSDGFWTRVDAREAAQTVKATPSLAAAAETLVELACRRGGANGDNVSLALARRSSRRRGWASLVQVFSTARKTGSG